MTGESMTNEENYCLDVAGYLIVRNVLTAAQVQACNQALNQVGQVDGMLAWEAPFCDPFLELRDHPVLARYLEQICGEEYRLDQGPRRLGELTGDAEAPLAGGSEWQDWSRAYRHQNGVRFCQGVQALWVLADASAGDGGFALIPASHKSHVETPEEVLSGVDDMGLTVQPVLQAGDLLLCAETVVRGVRTGRGQGSQRLLACGYISAVVRPSNGADPPGEKTAMPAWTAGLTPVQRAVLHNPERPYPPSVVQTDGETCWLEEDPGIFHPSIYSRDPDSDIDEKEFYFWDLCGHLVLPGVMDEDWLAAANEAIERHADRIGTGGSAAGESKRLAGTGMSSLSNPWELPEPYCEPFRRMIAHPALVQRLNWMMGSGFECMLCNTFCSRKGASGHFLHAGGEPATVANHYRLQNGRAYCEYVNVAWQLRDVTAADGGFVCVPGSHKGRYLTPEGIKSCDDEMGLVQHVEMKAGDVLFFLASTQTHGAYPWTGEQDRRAVFFQYRSRNLYAP